MQYTLTNKALVWITTLLLPMLMVTGCGSVESIEDIPTSAAPTVTQANIKTTSSAFEPTEHTAAIPTTPPTKIITHPQSATSEAGFRVCGSTQDSTAISGAPAPQDGLSMELDSLIPPAPPAKVELSISEGGVVVTWQGTGTDVDEFYNIYQRVADDECWIHIGAVPIEGKNTGGYELYVILTSKANTQSFAVTTVDIYGNESDISTITNTAGQEN